MLKRIKLAALVVGLFFWASHKSHAQTRPHEVIVAAASDLKYALDDIIKEFKQARPDIDLKVTYGSSGNFFAQLSHKAPFDIYFSADIDYPKKLIEKGLAGRDSLFTYALGRIVVWVPNSSKIDLEEVGIKALLDHSVRKVAIANPAHAPYGRAAEAAMKNLGVYEAVKSRLVLGDNIAQASQFVEAGAASIGIIAMSLAVSPAMIKRGHYWPVPQEAYPKLEQGGVILNWAKDPQSAKIFGDFVLSDKGRAILKRYGLIQPGK